MPPPAKCGARLEPWRAPPVPFCRHGFAPPPRTLPRVFVNDVPRRRALSSARTDSWTSGPLKRAPKATSSRSTLPESPSTLALAIGAHLHHAVARPGDRAADHQQGVARVDAHDLEAALRDALVAHLARPADALEHARGVGGGADRARRAHVVRAVADGAAGEVVALDGALEALALRDAGDLHLLAGFERLDRDGLAHGQLAGLVAELDEVLHRRRVGFAQVAELALGQVLLARGAERELDGLVAVTVERADARDGTGPGLEHGDALDAPVVEEETRHAELLGEDRRHGSARQADLDVDARGQTLEPLKRVARLRRRLVDVDEPLVRADLEVLARVLVLERRPDHAVHVLLGRQGDRTGHGRAGARRRLDDLLGRRLDGRVVVRLEADADLVLGGCCHSVSVFCLLSAGSFVLPLCAPKADPKPAGPAPPAAPGCRSGGGTAWSYRTATR